MTFIRSEMADYSSLAPEVGFNIPAEIGMSEKDIQTPCLMIDLDAFEKNVETMRAFCEAFGIGKVFI